jgi:hypothetical protein
MEALYVCFQRAHTLNPMTDPSPVPLQAPAQVPARVPAQLRSVRDMTGPNAVRRTYVNVPCAIVLLSQPDNSFAILIDKIVTGNYWQFVLEHKSVTPLFDLGRIKGVCAVRGSDNNPDTYDSIVATPDALAAYMASGTTMLKATVTSVTCGGYVGVERVTVVHPEGTMDTFTGFQETHDRAAVDAFQAYVATHFEEEGDTTFEWTPFVRLPQGAEASMVTVFVDLEAYQYIETIQSALTATLNVEFDRLKSMLVHRHS